ncbi:MAG: hypothetical protein NTV86_14425 [Planctomycetota bacterium]|nr:hypothetical protein [Planctomycetota bacterium]
MKTKAGKIRDSYFDLVREFPLVAVKTADQYEAAVGFLGKLAIRDEASLDEGERTYLEALTQFVGDYEEAHLRARIGHMKPLEALKFLMAENHMKPADLGLVLGSRSLASQVLNGKRGLSKAIIARLSERFKVAPGLFFEKA